MTSTLLLLAVMAPSLAAEDDAIAKAMKKFEGTWVLASAEHEGKKIDDELVKKGKITYAGKEMTLVTPHQTKETIKATMTRIDASKTPAEMDWTRSAGPNPTKTMMAIFEFTGEDEYRICFDPACKERPKDFSTKAGSGHYLHVWKREKK